MLCYGTSLVTSEVVKIQGLPPELQRELDRVAETSEKYMLAS